MDCTKVAEGFCTLAAAVCAGAFMTTIAGAIVFHSITKAAGYTCLAGTCGLVASPLIRYVADKIDYSRAKAKDSTLEERVKKAQEGKDFPIDWRVHVYALING